MIKLLKRRWRQQVKVLCITFIFMYTNGLLVIYVYRFSDFCLPSTAVCAQRLCSDVFGPYCVELRTQVFCHHAYCGGICSLLWRHLLLEESLRGQTNVHWAATCIHCTKSYHLSKESDLLRNRQIVGKPFK